MTTGLGDGAVITTTPGSWALESSPGVGSRANLTKAAVAGQHHVCTAISFGIHTVAAPVATSVEVVLRDGATGAGTVLQTWVIRVPATADLNVITHSITGLNIVGSVNTAMTLEFNVALANTQQAVNLSGYTLT